MQSEVQFAGFGGQGIMLMGQILAQAAMQAGFEVVWIPSYGPEMRGGTAYCTVVISDRPIGSPIIRNPKHLVAMNRPSLEKFASTVKPGGVIFINSSIISIEAGREDVDVLKVPIIEIAKDLGNVRAANIIALAAFVARSKIVDFDLLRESVKEKFAEKEKLIPLNMKALEEGRKAALS
ncbi:MAG: 2-oxoacid:acceptor oxidoreductase family protein [Desulfobacterales bacterium]|jgi:2-oxoglutarate ferredoxin oxidoreductase subunit gamma|nr:MAG: 2-oxoacid:acceptor oxidoreductase family protein [Desulfobacterales bacterium]